MERSCAVYLLITFHLLNLKIDCDSTKSKHVYVLFIHSRITQPLARSVSSKPNWTCRFRAEKCYASQMVFSWLHKNIVFWTPVNYMQTVVCSYSVHSYIHREKYPCASCIQCVLQCRVCVCALIATLTVNLNQFLLFARKKRNKI